MKKFVILVVSMCIWSCAEPPVRFDEASKAEQTIALNGASQTLGEVLAHYKGDVVLLDIWASWCRDCIVGLPELNRLQERYPQVNYVFLSVDRSQKSWRNALQRYQIKGDHYFMPEGQKGALNDFLNSNWIPRYLILNTDGSIAMYKAKRITDPLIEETLQKLIN